MVLRNGIGEKHVEPVSVAHFRFAEVSVTGFGGVEQSALAVTVVVFVDEAVHTTVHSGVSGAEKVGTVQPAFLFHFFVDSHLFLRIHDIEFFVAGDSTGGELARITDLADSGTSFLSGDYDNACHRTCTVNGGCRTVFQNLEIPKQILIAMLFRRHKMIIPHGDDMLEPGDNVYFVGQQSAIKEFEETFVNTYEKIERVMIIGAGRTGRFLAPMLEEQGLFVKVIEKNKDRCQLIAQKLENGIVLCGDGTDIDLLTEEGIAEADVVICITEDDKLNLLLALMAKHLGAKKTIVRVARNEYVELMEKVGVDIVLSSRLLSSGEVLRFVRKGGIVSVSLLEGAKAEALEIILPDDCEVIGKSLKDIKLPRACLVCAVVHDNEAVVPNGNTVLYAGDRIIIFVKSEFVKRVMPFFESRG